MVNDRFTDLVVEQAFLAWLRAADRCSAHCPYIALAMPAAQPGDHSDPVLVQRLRGALIPRLISGDLRIEVAEDPIERALA